MRCQLPACTTRGRRQFAFQPKAIGPPPRTPQNTSVAGHQPLKPLAQIASSGAHVVEKSGGG